MAAPSSHGDDPWCDRHANAFSSRQWRGRRAFGEPFTAAAAEGFVVCLNARMPFFWMRSFDVAEDVEEAGDR